uniref:Secreted protein n=1 Tax=Ascaris lumbricoides TaxID=6252 RepID=A0A0M3IWN9_ASCLU
MRLVVAILLTEILVICSPDTGDQVNHEVGPIDGGREKGAWLKNLRSKVRNFFFGHYGGGEGNNYGGTNIGSVYVINLNFSIG